MFKKVFMISCTVLAVAALPQYAQDLSEFVPGQFEPSETAELPLAASAKPEPKTKLAHYATGVRSATIPADNTGHFTADFRVNGRYVRGLIDTGATYVALNATTARNLGLRLAASDFQHQVRTANGLTQAARVTLDRMDVGSITVSDVEAFVLSDQALSSTLIGMSFMSKIQSYRVKGNTLELVN